MFWRLESTPTTCNLATVLDKPDVTLTEILDDEYVLQEARSGNKRLIEFLVKPENLSRLFEICVNEPEASDDLKTKYKYCHLASEILSSGVNSLIDAFWSNEKCLETLARFVSPGDVRRCLVNPLLASFYSKIFTVLVDKRFDEVLSFMQKRPDFVDNLIANLDASAVVEVLFCLCRGGYQGMDNVALSVKTWLVENGLLSKLLSQLDPEKSSDTHRNVTFLLCELIRTLRRDQLDREELLVELRFEDPLVDQFESQSFLDALIKRILVSVDDPFQYSESVISSGCAICVTLLQTVVIPDRQPLLRKLYPFDEETTTGPTSGSAVRVLGVSWEPDKNRLTERLLASNLSRFKRLIEIPGNASPPVVLPMGQVDVPLGRTRLALTEVLVKLLANCLPAVHEEFVKLDLASVLLDLFFKHKWNNFLHTNVVNCFMCALYGRLAGTGPQSGGGGSAVADGVEEELDDFGEPIHRAPSYPSPLLTQLLHSKHILQLIVRIYDEVETTKALAGSSIVTCCCYLGHLMRLAVSIYNGSMDGPNAKDIKHILSSLPESEREAWNKFVNVQLKPYIKQNEPDQVGSQPSNADGPLTDRMEDCDAAAAAAAGSAVSQAAAENSPIAASRIDSGCNEKMNNDEEKTDRSAGAVSVPAISNFELMDETTQEEWKEKEITFDRKHDAAASAFSPTSVLSSADDKTKVVTTTSTEKPIDSKIMLAQRGPSWSDDDDEDEDQQEEAMDVDRDAIPAEWVSSNTSAAAASASPNWAKFDDWPSTQQQQDASKGGAAPTTTSGDDKKKQQQQQNKWASFDQFCASKNPSLDDMWS